MKEKKFAWGGQREGAGRRSNGFPRHHLRIACTDEELRRIQQLSTRRRALALLAEAAVEEMDDWEEERRELEEILDDFPSPEDGSEEEAGPGQVGIDSEEVRWRE